ncbi:hypothetical protein ACS0TY_003847 [Phlomoides rotata]
MAEIIDPSQSAFVPGRLITDNILLAYEMMHWLRHRRGKACYAALKLDMSKPYNRIEWRYLERILSKLGFDQHCIRLIMDCVSSVSFSLNINGVISPPFLSSRGLRQGDPISPFLFVLCAQGLSAAINGYEQTRKFEGISIARGCLKMSYLFFTDDSLVFFKVSESMVYFKTYEKASGQLINYEKLAVTFSPNSGDATVNVVKQRMNI